MAGGRRGDRLRVRPGECLPPWEQPPPLPARGSLGLWGHRGFVPERQPRGRDRPLAKPDTWPEAAGSPWEGGSVLGERTGDEAGRRLTPTPRARPELWGPLQGAGTPAPTSGGARLSSTHLALGPRPSLQLRLSTEASGRLALTAGHTGGHTPPPAAFLTLIHRPRGGKERRPGSGWILSPGNADSCCSSRRTRSIVRDT